MKNLLGLMVAVAVILPATQARQLTKEAIGKNNMAHESSVLARFDAARAVAIGEGEFTTRVHFGAMPYAVTFDVKRKLVDAGYMVDIDRVSHLYVISW